MLTDSKETEILSEIRDSEKKVGDIIEKAKIEKQEIIDKAVRDSLKLLAAKKEEIRKSQEEKLIDFINQASSRKAKKLGEGKKLATQIKAEAEKNVNNSIDFVMKKFEEMI